MLTPSLSALSWAANLVPNLGLILGSPKIGRAFPEPTPKQIRLYIDQKYENFYWYDQQENEEWTVHLYKSMYPVVDFAEFEKWHQIAIVVNKAGNVSKIKSSIIEVKDL